MSHDGNQQRGRRFRVALSFPGEHRAYLQEVDRFLAAALGEQAVFYDNRYKHEIAVADADLYLQAVYADDAELMVVVLCREYREKPWCRVEWRVARDKIMNGRGSEVMFFRFDDEPVPGVFSHDGYIDARRTSPKEAADWIQKRLESNRGHAAAGGPPVLPSAAPALPSAPGTTSSTVIASGARSVAIGGNAPGAIVATGDSLHIQHHSTHYHFTGPVDPAALQEAQARAAGGPPRKPRPDATSAAQFGLIPAGYAAKSPEQLEQPILDALYMLRFTGAHCPVSSLMGTFRLATVPGPVLRAWLRILPNELSSAIDRLQLLDYVEVVAGSVALPFAKQSIRDPEGSPKMETRLIIERPEGGHVCIWHQYAKDAETTLARSGVYAEGEFRIDDPGALLFDLSPRGHIPCYRLTATGVKRAEELRARQASAATKQDG